MSETYHSPERLTGGHALNGRGRRDDEDDEDVPLPINRCGALVHVFSITDVVLLCFFLLYSYDAPG